MQHEHGDSRNKKREKEGVLLTRLKRDEIMSPFSKEAELPKKHTGPPCSHGMFWERRKKKNGNILAMLYTQEIQLNRRMMERVEVFISTFISLRNLTFRFIIHGYIFSP